MSVNQPQVKDHAPAFFRDDLARLNAVLEPHIFVDPSDGWKGINPETAPPEALRIYGELTSYGYAQGWL